MKEVALNIDFADSSYKSCKTINDDLIVYLDSWDDKIIKIVFSNVLKFLFNGDNFISGIFEQTEENLFLSEALSRYYEGQKENHPFKMFVITDIDDSSVFEVIAEKISVTIES